MKPYKSIKPASFPAIHNIFKSDIAKLLAGISIAVIAAFSEVISSGLAFEVMGESPSHFEPGRLSIKYLMILTITVSGSFLLASLAAIYALMCSFTKVLKDGRLKYKSLTHQYQLTGAASSVFASIFTLIAILTTSYDLVETIPINDDPDNFFQDIIIKTSFHPNSRSGVCSNLAELDLVAIPAEDKPTQVFLATRNENNSYSIKRADCTFKNRPS